MSEPSPTDPGDMIQAVRTAISHLITDGHQEAAEALDPVAFELRRISTALTTAQAERDKMLTSAFNWEGEFHVMRDERDAAIVRAAHAADEAARTVKAAEARREEMRASRDAIYESRQEERAKVRDLEAQLLGSSPADTRRKLVTALAERTAERDEARDALTKAEERATTLRGDVQSMKDGTGDQGCLSETDR